MKWLYIKIVRDHAFRLASQKANNKESRELHHSLTKNKALLVIKEIIFISQN